MSILVLVFLLYGGGGGGWGNSTVRLLVFGALVLCIGPTVFFEMFCNLYWFWLRLAGVTIGLLVEVAETFFFTGFLKPGDEIFFAGGKPGV